MGPSLSPFLPSLLNHLYLHKILLTAVCSGHTLPSVSSVVAASALAFPLPVPTAGYSRCSVVYGFFVPDMFPRPQLFSYSTAPQRVPVASPSAHNISSSGGAPDRTNFPRGVSSRSTFHAGQLRQVRDQQNLPYGVTPASPSGHSQGRRGASGSIFSKFTSKFVRR